MRSMHIVMRRHSFYARKCRLQCRVRTYADSLAIPEHRFLMLKSLVKEFFELAGRGGVQQFSSGTSEVRRVHFVSLHFVVMVLFWRQRLAIRV
ncbi:hypothetical protein M758_12G101200 [Ceratodon purpureus]|nr:hypothetical protein M758_12G101200 [Ceratodon purpureus]